MNKMIGLVLLIGVVIATVGAYWQQSQPATQSSTNNKYDDQFQELTANMNLLASQMENINVEIRRMNALMETNIQAQTSYIPQPEEIYNTEPVITSYQLTDPSIENDIHATTKISLIQSLDNPNITLSSLTESEDMQTLPIELQQEVIREAVRKFNSGEINKYSFIPGYKD